MTREDYKIWCFDSYPKHYDPLAFLINKDGIFIDRIVEWCYKGWLYDMQEYNGKVPHEH